MIFLLVMQKFFAQKPEDVCYNPTAVRDTKKKSIESTALAVVDGDSLKIDHLERLQYFIDTNGRKLGIISLAWEKVRIDLPLAFR